MEQDIPENPPRSLSLPDEAATTAFAARLARLLQPGDCVLLSGELGAGKSTLARAAIQTIMGRDEPVPSPTFTITQRYEAPEMTLVHADLYRLGDAEELIEIGLDADFDAAVCFVEWPGLLGDLRPDDRLELSLEYSADGGRTLSIVGLGARPAAIASALFDDRDALVRRFADDAGWPEAELRALDGDASRRRYFRAVRETGGCAMLMDAPPLTDGSAPAFAHVTRILAARGLSVPAILHDDAARGFLLLEDLGDDLYSRLCIENPAGEQGWYEAAVDLLGALRVQSDAPDLPPYDDATLQREAALLCDWWMPAAGMEVSADLSAEYLGLMTEATASVAAARGAVVLRDYHADNLIWLAEREGIGRVGLLDYQDALLGHPAYDLVSLLEDARRDVAPELAAHLLSRYLSANPDQDAEAFRAAYDTLGAQRNAKIVGIFARLCLRDGKSRYLSMIPRVWAHLMRDLSAPHLGELRGFVARHVPPPTPELLARIASQVAK